MLVVVAAAAVPLMFAARTYRDFRRERDVADYLVGRGAVVRTVASSRAFGIAWPRVASVQFTQDQFHQVGGDSQLTAADFDRLARLPELEELVLHGDVLPADLVPRLASLGTLRSLVLLHGPLDDEQVRRLGALPNLRTLTLEAAGVTESALDDLRRTLPDLEIFDD